MIDLTTLWAFVHPQLGIETEWDYGPDDAGDGDIYGDGDGDGQGWGPSDEGYYGLGDGYGFGDELGGGTGDGCGQGWA